MTLAADKLAWAGGRWTGRRHIAIIMDGNGRWAAERGLPRAEGHRQGVESVRRTVEAALELGIGHLTLFSFSSENWTRPKQEINDLFGLLRRFIRRDLADLHKNGVKIRVIGTRAGLDADLLRLIDDAVELTKDNTALNLTIAFNYGARDEIARAARRIAEDVARRRRSIAADVTEERFGAYLDTADHPRSRPPHPHERRASSVQLSAVAARLCRVRVRRHLLAGFLARAVRSSDRRISAAQPPLRRHLGEIDRVTLTGTLPNDKPRDGQPKPEIVLRVVSAVVLAAVALGAAIASPWSFLVLVIVGGGLVAWEWGTAHPRQRVRRHRLDRSGQRLPPSRSDRSRLARAARSSFSPPRPRPSGSRRRHG